MPPSLCRIGYIVTLRAQWQREWRGSLHQSDEPIRLFPSLYELSLKNDVILWTLPAAMKEWLNSDQGSQCLMAADLQPALGQFSETCDQRALNSGIRGLPPRFDLGARLQSMLARSGILLQSELDEQGLQAAVLSESGLLVIPTEDVS